MPKDFDERYEEYFSLIGAPLLVATFINQLKQEMCEYIKKFDNDFPKNDLVAIVKRDVLAEGGLTHTGATFH